MSAEQIASVDIVAVRKKVGAGLAWAVVFIAGIVAANWLIVRYGFIPVGFGLMAPAGVYAAGVTFPARDMVQRHLGRRWAVAAVLGGCLITFLVSSTLAVASAVTFLVSEGLDTVLFSRLRRRFPRALVVSSVASAVIDSLVFLRLAHIPYRVALGGQIAGKLEAVAAAVLVVFALTGGTAGAVLARNPRGVVVATDGGAVDD